MNIFFYFKDTHNQIMTWQPPTTSAEPAIAYDYKRTFTTPDGVIETNRAIDVKNLLNVYAYRTQAISSNLHKVKGFSKANCKLYIKVAGDSTFTKLSSVNDLGVSSNGTVRINCNKYNSSGSQPSSGSINVILDIDSGYPASKVKVTTTLDNITFENAVNEVNENSDFTFNFSASAGYEIATLTTNIGVVNIATNKLTATITGKATSDIVINGSASLIPIKHNITYNLNHITCTNQINEIVENEQFNLHFVSDSGFEITELTSNIGTITVAQDKLSADIVGVATTDIMINGTATQIQKIYTVTYNLNNITCTNPVNTVVENESFNLSFIPVSGYTIETLTSNIGTITIADNKKSATIVGIASDNIVITGSSTLEKHYVKISGTLNNCYCSYENNEEISSIKPCEIIANSGHVFPAQIRYPYIAIINDIEVVKYATVIDNGYRLKFDFSFDSGISTIILNGEYTAVKEVDSISDFVNTYYVTKQTLKELAKTRFMKISSESGVTYVDLGEFIVGLYVLPLGIPKILITSEQNIKLGYEDSKVPANVINAYKWEYDLGVITIPAKYNNAYDFVKTEVFLNVPFFDQQELPIYTIGHDLHITMLFDCYSGSATLLVKDTFTNSYIVNKTQKIVIDVPYVQTGLNTVFNKLGNTNINPLIDTCFVNVIRNTPYNNDNEYGKNLNASVVIGSIQGYAEFSKSTVISTVATDTELEMINRLLANGVYIN